MAYTIDLEDITGKGKKFNKTRTISERQEAKRNREPDHDDTLQGVEEAFRRAAENRKKIWKNV